MALPAVAFQSALADLRPQLLHPLQEESLPLPTLCRKSPNPFTVALSLHVTADLIQDTPELIKRFVIKRLVKAIAGQTDCAKPRRAGAYVFRKFLRFISLEQRLCLTLTAFVYANIEQFELFERWTPELKMDVAPAQAPEAHLANLKTHAGAFGLGFLFPSQPRFSIF
jgi:hypothetical protein